MYKYQCNVDVSSFITFNLSLPIVMWGVAQQHRRETELMEKLEK